MYSGREMSFAALLWACRWGEMLLVGANDYYDYYLHGKDDGEKLCPDKDV